MLHGLFGSKSVEKILLFLLVNEKAYATQLHRLLHTPLTPVQKGLEKLEKEGILISLLEGKTRFYTFNPRYPLLEELEVLLKKAYTLLAPHEKSRYYFVRHVPKMGKTAPARLTALWEELNRVTAVTFQFRTRGGNQGHGTGSVTREKGGTTSLIFHEKGAWQGVSGQEFLFRNAFRWTLDTTEGRLTLEHLRHGINHPVFLFHLVPQADNSLESAHTHICGKDTYLGHLEHHQGHIILTWRILGPKKNEEMTYTYV